MAVVSVLSWRPLLGRLPEFLGLCSEAKKIHERLGARIRTLQAGAGPRPGTITYILEFDDMIKLGEFVEKLNVDQEWQAFGAKLGSDPPVELVEQGLASDLTLP